MVYCTSCKEDVDLDSNQSNGFACCTQCGMVLDENLFSNDTNFAKAADGSSQAVGTFVGDGGGGRSRGGLSSYRSSESHEQTVHKGLVEIESQAERLHMPGRDNLAPAAHRLYRIAVTKNFTRGRRTAQVAAACLYIACRQDNKAYMLIDFSEILATNV
ncbi:hypothetical protein CYMTET_27223 [Cymbomonas tetramitiformis]|uniref:Transcription factor TFIIB cyclin-like domain-containing protein n=1 Tax=Cymbomonas tetramitiformis TaxID=36881 RepID=A0AAE0FQU0_9CHLO|nr:hypothetical protein CYMTET_27223 [Cymbomonas tetramitiformis]